jgi:hypothetical protein
MATLSVQLPSEVTDSIPQRFNGVRLLTYVLAVEESARAKSQSKALLDAAQRQLTAEIQARKKAADSVETKIDELEAEYARKKEAREVEAEGKRESSSRISYWQREREKNWRGWRSDNTDHWLWPLSTAFFLGLLVFVGAGLILWVATLGGWKGSPWESAFMCCDMPLLLLGGAWSLIRILWQIGVYSARAHRMRVIDNELELEISELDRKLSRKHADLEKTLSSARAREAKARAALDWLQGQQGRTNG